MSAQSSVVPPLHAQTQAKLHLSDTWISMDEKEVTNTQ